MRELSELIARHCHRNTSVTPLPGVSLHRLDASTKLEAVTTPPLFCVVAEGRKRVRLGNDDFYYDPSTYLITSADLPITGQVTEAPYLGLTLEINPGVLADLVVGMDRTSLDRSASKAMAVCALEGDLLDTLLRLLRLIDQPAQMMALAPIIERELLFRLLLGPCGQMLRQLALPTSQLSHISRAINFIHRQYDRLIRIEELAELANMSSPSFHRHFRAVTGMSPLQFQKRIRLQEARRRLLSENQGAANVAMEVGYESASQFSREYRRMFGAPPAQETALARQSVATL